MKLWLTLFIILIGIFTEAEPTPFETELPEGKETMITCHPPIGDIPLIKTFNADNDPALRDNFHYRLYLPKGYNENPKKQYPVLFIQSPGGNAKFVSMGKRLKKDGWIVAMLKEASNKSTNSINCFLAVHDDVIRRCRTAKGAKFITGMSGGARNTSLYALLRPGVRGIFMQAAGIVWGMEQGCHLRYEDYPTHIYVAGLFGNKDCNKVEGPRFHRGFTDVAQYKMFGFSGGHTWCKPKAFDEAMNWMERKVFLDDPRPIKEIPSCNGLLKPVEKEPLSKAAYYWYFELLQQRFRDTQDLYTKYSLCKDMERVARLGKFKSKKVTSYLAKMRQYKGKLFRQKEVRDGCKAHKEWKEIEKSESKLMEFIKESEEKIEDTYTEFPKPCKMIVGPEIKEEMIKFKKTADKFLAKYGTSTYAVKVKERLMSWYYELDVEEMKAE